MKNKRDEKFFIRQKYMKIGSESWKKYVEEKFIYKDKHHEGNILIRKSNRRFSHPSKYEKAYEIYLKTGCSDGYDLLMRIRRDKANERYRISLLNGTKFRNAEQIREEHKQLNEDKRNRYFSNPYKVQRMKSKAYLKAYWNLLPVMFEKSWLLDRLTFDKNNLLEKNEFLYTEFIDDLTILNMHKKIKLDKNKEVKDIVKMHIMCKEEIEEQEHEDEE